jgi:hypothetical protein
LVAVSTDHSISLEETEHNIPNARFRVKAEIQMPGITSSQKKSHYQALYERTVIM